MEKSKTDPLEMQQEINHLYTHFKQIKGLLRSIGCDAVTAEDIFQEALIIYLRKKEDPQFDFQLDPLHYIKNTCKFLWFNQARKEQKQGTTSFNTDIEEVEEPWLEKELQFKSLENALEKVGNQCRELLHLFYGLGWNMVDIAKKLHLRNDKVAKAQKYRCIQKAKELVAQAQLNVESNQF